MPDSRSAAQQSLQARHLARDVEPALGRQLGALLRHQAAVLRAHLARDGDHRVGGGHLEVHAGLQRGAHAAHVVVLDVPAVLAQMQRDAVGAGLLSHQRRIQRIGIRHAPHLPQRGHVVDVDAELDGMRKHDDSTSVRLGAVRPHFDQHFARPQRAAVEALVEGRPQQPPGIGEAARVRQFLARQRQQRGAHKISGFHRPLHRAPRGRRRCRYR